MKMILVWFTHLPLAPHICVSELVEHWFREWLLSYSAPSHYLNLCWVIFNWTFRNKLRWNFDIKTKLFINKKESENIVCEKVGILSSGRWVKISLKFVSTGLNNNMPIFNEIRAWCQADDKPLSEPMLAYFIHAYIYHLATMSIKMSVGAN